jgi:hypothetical protein
MKIYILSGSGWNSSAIITKFNLDIQYVIKTNKKKIAKKK